MNSKYAYIRYIKSINSGDLATTGEAVQLEYNIIEGRSRLVSIAEFERLKRDFPDCIEGNIVKQEDLLYVIGLCYDEIKSTARMIAEDDKLIGDKFKTFEDAYTDTVLCKRTGELKDFQVEDLANKYYVLQDKIQRAEDKVFQKVNIQK